MIVGRFVKACSSGKSCRADDEATEKSQAFSGAFAGKSLAWVSPMTTAAPSSAIPMSVGGAAAPAPPGFFDDFFETEDGGFSFHDILSVVNPLQHIPVVSTIYRAITGDTIKPLARLAGDTLYGGWMGCVSSLANIVFEKETGKDFGDTVLSFLEGGDGTKSVADTTAGAGAVPSAQPQIAVLPLATTALKPAQIITPPIEITAPPADVATGAPTPLQGSLLSADRPSAALVSSMAGANIDPQIAQRALYAYRRSLSETLAPLDLSPSI
jgi:hypothetical protein